MGADPAEVAALLDRVRPLTGKPLIVKLTPNASDVPAVAHAAEQAGADALSLINTIRGMALDPATGEPWLGGTTGGVSGPAVRAIALAQVNSVSAATSIPLIGMGGVQSGSRRPRSAAGGRKSGRGRHRELPRSGGRCARLRGA